MRERYKNALMWGLYAALVLLVLVLQTVSFGRPRFFGVKLCFVPVLVACVSMHVGSEAGCVFGMACGLVWTLSGRGRRRDAHCAFALCGAVAGYLCDRYLGAEPCFRASHEPSVPSFLASWFCFCSNVWYPPSASRDCFRFWRRWGYRFFCARRYTWPHGQFERQVLDFWQDDRDSVWSCSLA